MNDDSFGSRLKRAWNVFFNKDPTPERQHWQDGGYYYRPDRPRFTGGNERTIVTAILNRIALDAAAIDVRHVRLDENGRYTEDINSCLNECLTLRANIDQHARAFMQDIYMSMFDEGSVAIVPTETTEDPILTAAYDIGSLRTGKVVEWFPTAVRVLVYNERKGRKEEITLPKSVVAIAENPFYAVMNERNSTLQRLIRKLRILDAVDEYAGSGKMNLIVQLPYVVKTEGRRQQAEERRSDIERQLTGSKYGIAYTDGTEKITQLNRPLENNLLGQIEYLTNLLMSQLGLTQGILDGTADENTMLNYMNRIVEPVVAAATDAMAATFLSRTARKQRQSIEYFRDPFRLVPVSQIAEIADKFTRNEIMTSNEIRQIVGMKPSDDPNADELRNKNLNRKDNEPTEGAKIQNAADLPPREEVTE